ncbi:YtxH domain-containing protein [Niallia sp. XMNu-256]|uniref:YtxH domain-containing protein n=1 Tax=Niallia sp. XMNu-256 TaxID=3082444 RepID=UPI0030D3C7CA
MSKSKFWKGVLLGALAGGALSLFDRETRKVVVGNCQKTTDKITYYARHPQEAVDQLKESTSKIRQTIEEVGEEVSFIAEKIDELKSMTPQVTDFVKETKETFIEKEV